MFWLAPRVLLALLSVMAVATAGAWLLADSAWASWGAVGGAGVAVALICLIDSWRGLRLLRWLSGHQDVDAPVMAGFWGSSPPVPSGSSASVKETSDASRISSSSSSAASRPRPTGC